MIKTISVLGAGNLATHLADVLIKKGYLVSQVYSRTKSSAKELGQKLGVEYTYSINELNLNVDAVFVALKDSAVNDLLSKIGFQNKLLIHCSGSLPLDVLKDFSTNIGVLYPLQTFSKSRNVDFNSIPVFIEANSKKNEEKLLHLANSISGNVSILDSEKRKILHISAVFACNFVNHFYSIANEVLNTKDIPFDVLRPLILETAQKVQDLEPKTAQTGPAVRFDDNIISDHLNQLSESPKIQELYNLISKCIFEYHQEKEK